jgi:hypothetical protein
MSLKVARLGPHIMSAVWRLPETQRTSADYR